MTKLRSPFAPRPFLQTKDTAVTNCGGTCRNLLPDFGTILPTRSRNRGLQAFRHREGKEKDGARTAGGAGVVLVFRRSKKAEPPEMAENKPRRTIPAASL
jgi:hypothetical protein